MSWNSYTDNLLASGKIDKAMICSSAGNAIWANTNGYTASIPELQTIVTGFTDPSRLYTDGIHLAGDKYFVIKADDRSIYGKKDTEGIVLVKTKQVLLVAHYPEGTQAGEAATIVERLADFLINSGY